MSNKNIWSMLTLAPGQPRDTWRPTITGRNFAAACGHYLGTAAAVRILERGGNAVDAGVAAAMALAVLQSNVVSFAGVAPTLIYLRREERVVSLAGLGYWPAGTDYAALVKAGGKLVPEGVMRTVVPAAPATHIEALRRYGTISFEEAATPAYELAHHGFAMYPLLAYNIDAVASGFDRYPENARIFRPGGKTPQVGQVFRQTDLAKSIHTMIEAEKAARGDREAKLRAVHDCFYKGPIAEAIVDYHAREGGFMTRADLAGFEVPIEEPITCRYRGIDVYSCDAWCQGIVLLETLKILEGVDLPGIEHNSTRYIHTVAEALNLAFSDREAYVSDPRFVDVPTGKLLSDAYGKFQLSRIADSRAFGEMPPPGDPSALEVAEMPEFMKIEPTRKPAPFVEKDTIYGCIVDREGNAYSCTPSDNANDTPIIPGTGLAVSSRGNQSRLVDGHPAQVKAGKRPRLTPAPAMSTRDGKLFMAFGTPGGDMQMQAMLQVFLNHVDFNMTVQGAIEAARFGTFNFPISFVPHEYVPGRLCVENRVPEAVRKELARMGHAVENWPHLAPPAAGVCAIRNHRDDTGLLHAGADPRREGYAMAW
ncbi:MAG: gamma-glutamyltransferase family protein [Hyphomicrobiales bacterium]